MKRKWLFHTLEVGKDFTVAQPPKTFRTLVHTYGARSGKCFTVRRVVRTDPNSGLVVRRFA